LCNRPCHQIGNRGNAGSNRSQINQRDGFFLVGRRPEPVFDWKKLEGQTLLADHGLQPLVMLKYAVRHNGADWKKIKVIDAGTPEKMQAAFGAGSADYVHLQGIHSRPLKPASPVADFTAPQPRTVQNPALPS